MRSEREVEIMRLRTLFLSGVLAGGLTLTLGPRVAADPPPWAPAWGHSRHADVDHDNADQHYWRHRNGDRDYNRNGSHYYWNNRNYRGNDPQYSKLVDRMNNDRSKIAEIG